LKYRLRKRAIFEFVKVGVAKQYKAENIGVKQCPFGMMMEERSYTATAKGYRFGFQGQEGDDEVSGEGNNWNYKYRMHDARLGRFFAVDPLTHKYPQWSAYQFSGNQVISTIELEGAEALHDANKNGNTPESGKKCLIEELGFNTKQYTNSTSTSSSSKASAGAAVGVAPSGGSAQPGPGNPNPGGGSRAPGGNGSPPGSGNSPSPKNPTMTPVNTSWSAIFSFGVRVGSAGGLIFIPLQAGDTECGGVDCITIYRGVNSGHPKYKEALQGIAVPLGTHTDPVLHNTGNTNSVFTSWTYNIETATDFADPEDGGGVILRMKVPINYRGDAISPDGYAEGEILLRGVRQAHSVTLLNP
jgi:RHS repeat-associated protein